MSSFVEKISLSYPSIKFFSQKEIREILEIFLSKYCKSLVFHYFWSNFKKPENIAAFKIAADNSFYAIHLDKIMPELSVKNIIILAIDKCCNIGEGKDLLLSINRQDLKRLLLEYYWELDEICIFDNTYKWFIAVNHCFEVYVCGEPIIRNINEIISKALEEKTILKVIN